MKVLKFENHVRELREILLVDADSLQNLWELVQNLYQLTEFLKRKEQSATKEKQDTAKGE